MKKKLLFVLTLFMSIIIYAQDAEPHCKDITQEKHSVDFCKNKHHFSLNKKGKKIHDPSLEVMDRFGNRYHRKINTTTSGLQKAIPNTPDYISPEGLFALYLATPNSNVTATNFTSTNTQGVSYRNVLAQVFADLEQLIVENTTTGAFEPVKIEIQSIQSSTGILGAASAYYSTAGFPDGSIIESNVWQAINSGANTPDDWDAYIRINFDKTWYTSFNDPNSITTNSFDLYTTLLHETMHALGFASAITNNGTSADGYYLPFDQKLKVNGSNLLTNNGNTWSFNNALNINVITAGCPSTTNVTLGNANLVVYTPATYASGSSLSHIDRNNDCQFPGTDYIMAPIASQGASKRLHTDEIAILCELNYTISSNYGNTMVVEFANPAIVTTVSNVNQFAVPGCNPIVFGADDLPAIPPVDNCTGSIVNISESTLLANDTGSNLTVTNLTAPDGTPITASTGISPNRTFQYSPEYPALGVVELQYQPMDDQGNVGNFTSVNITINACPGEQFGCTNEDPCNLVCNSDLTNDNLSGNCLYLNANNLPVGWREAFPSPDWMPNDPTCVDTDNLRTHTFMLGSTGGRASFAATVSAVNSQNQVIMTNEGVSASVSSMQPNTNYILSFHKADGVNPTRLDDSQGLNNIISENMGISVSLSNDFHAVGPQSFYTHNLTDGSITTNNSNFINFENNHISLINDATVTAAWSQTVVSFNSSSAPDYDRINFAHPVNNSFVAIGNTYPTINGRLHLLAIDQVEVIEDRIQQTPNIYNISCGETQDIGIDLCDVANMQYQWWDVTNTGTPIQLTDLVNAGNGVFDPSGILINNPSSNYIVSDVFGNGSQIQLSNIQGTLQLELRRVFPNTFGIQNLAINNNLDTISSTAQVTIALETETPQNANFTHTVDENCIFSFQSSDTYEIHQWDFNGDDIPDLEGAGTDVNIANPTYAFPSQGLYEVTHTVSNSCGTSSTIEFIWVSCQAQVCDNLQPDFSFLYNDFGCPIEFTGINEGDDCFGQTYLWEVFNDINNDGVLAPVELVFSSTNISFNESDFDFSLVQGNYTVQFSIIDPSGINSETLTVPWIIDAECYQSNCVDCFEYRGAIFQSIHETRECGIYAINVPDNDCYDVILYLDNVPSNPLPSGISEFSFDSNGDHSYFITVIDRDTGELCPGRPSQTRVHIDCCRECDPRTPEQIISTFWNSINQVENTCNYVFELPELELCYEVIIDWGDGHTSTHSNETNTPLEHQYTANDDYEVCIEVVANGISCSKRCKEINVECYPSNCTDCLDYRGIVFESIHETRECGVYEINVPENDCYDVILYLDNIPSNPLPSGISEFSFNSNGDHSYFITVIDRETGELCPGRPFPIRVRIDCCKDCDSQISEQIINTFWNGLDQVENTCNYVFELPELEFCYEAVVNWGDGHTSTYSSGTSTPLEHQYTANDDYEICIEVIANGIRCITKCKRIRVECTDLECPSSCKDVYDLIVGSIQETNNCGEYSIEIPSVIFNCYTVKLDYNDETYIQHDLVEGTNIFSYSENGNYSPTFYIYDIDNPDEACYKDSVYLTIDCAFCNPCSDILDTITINQTACNDFEIVLANPIDDCYTLEYHIDGVYQGDISASNTTISSLTIGTHDIKLFLYEPPYNASGNNCERTFTVQSTCFSRGMLKLFPNPANNNVKVELEDINDTIQSIVIKNLSGLILLEEKRTSNLNVTRLKPGIYFVTVITEKNKVYQKQLIIE